MELIPFPGSDSPPLQLEARAKWNGQLLDLEFTLSHPQLVAHLVNLPTSQNRRDELWKTTCFECFLTTEKMKPAYSEINLSPGGDWALYDFTSYRQGMKRSELSKAPVKTSTQEKTTWSYRLDLSDQDSLANQTLLVSLCAVIESKQGSVSYWSLVHGQPKPDFHHLEHFVHVLSPKE